MTESVSVLPNRKKNSIDKVRSSIKSIANGIILLVIAVYRVIANVVLDLAGKNYICVWKPKNH